LRGAAEQIATLSLCSIAPNRPAAAATAAGWCNRLLRLGITLPLAVVHDIGWLLAVPHEELRSRAQQAVQQAEMDSPEAGYQVLLNRIRESPIVQAVAGLRLRDELVSVLLARLFGQLVARYQKEYAPLVGVTLPLDPALYRLPATAPTVPDEARQFLRFLSRDPQALHLLTSLELLDVDMLRLLSAGTRPAALREATAQAALEGDGAAMDLINLVDLLQAIDAPEVRDIVRFSLELLPSVLETRRSAGSQHYPVGGYAAIERRGPLDAVLLSELCNDEEVFLARLSENELLYHGRERRHDEGRGEHHILIDASASMHGLRQVFARGLAVALAQKLLLLEVEVRLRFFDGRLYEPVTPQPDLAAALPYLLSFRSTRGRHYGRVFQTLLHELQGRSSGRPARGGSATAAGPVSALYILTHGECHIPTATVQALAKLAPLYGVFILPSSDLVLDYLPLLKSCQVISEEDLRQSEARRNRALQIVADTANLGR